MKIVILSIMAWLAMERGPAHAAAFTAGNVVVYRVGTGTGSLLTAATPVFLDEFAPGGALVQSIALPVAVAGAQRRFTASGTATSEGSLQRSADRQHLTFTGYDADAGTTGVATSTVASVPRVVGFADRNAVIDTTTAVTAFSANNIRSAVSDDGTGAWVCGGTSGVVYVGRGGSGTFTTVSSSSNNNRSIDIADGQLFFSSGSGTFRLAQVGTGSPKTSGHTSLPVSGGPVSTASPYQFTLLDLDAAVPGADTLYAADDTAGTGGIQKYCLNSGTWEARGNVAGGGEVTGIRGLTAAAQGGTVTLYATTSIRLVSLTDSSGYNGTLAGSFAVLASAAANTGFRGIDFAPVAAVPPAPALAIARSGGTVVVSWPSSAAPAWVLQQKENLASGPWLPSIGVTDNGSEKSLTLPTTAARQFFQLAFP